MKIKDLDPYYDYLLTEISWAQGITTVKGLNPQDAIIVGRWDNHDFYSAQYDHELFLFFVIDNKIAAYITLDAENEINGRIKLIRMENICGPKGSITALIKFAISHFKLKLIIDKNEDLTSEGLEWIVKLINNNRGFKITDQNGNKINTNELKKEHKRALVTGQAGPTSILIESLCRAEEIKLHYDILNILQPVFKFLYDKDND